MTPDLTALLNALDAKRRAATPERTHANLRMAFALTAQNLWGDSDTGPWSADSHEAHEFADRAAPFATALPPEVVGALTDCVRALQRIQQVDAPPDYGVTRKAWDAGAEALAALATRLGGGK